MPKPSSQPQRLDARMVELGLVSSRNRAARLIREGTVSVAGSIVRKPAHLVRENDAVECLKEEPFVGRGGEKLAAALDHFSISPQGWHCLDVGASTGGFTDCLLQRGATSVCAIDVGHGQLHPRLASDSRVQSLEGINARHLKPGELGDGFDLIVMDVSFISLTLVLPAVLAQAGSNPASLIALIKPQFELSSNALNRKGVVTDERLRRQALDRVIEACSGHHPWTVKGWFESPVVGGDGNREYLMYARKN